MTSSHNTQPRSIQQLMNLDGRVALITGGGGHIGRAIGSALAELGGKIALLDSNGEAASKVSDSIAATYGVETMVLELDVADDDALRAAPSKVASELGS
ncbi:MAG: SDR family NAD(P)-dependent oxidoreductase, partial [Arenibacter algicola]|nr:SDR family NAD(P)-dependent oxidoreductase [Arenibacter algicola]